MKFIFFLLLALIAYSGNAQTVEQGFPDPASPYLPQVRGLMNRAHDPASIFAPPEKLESELTEKILAIQDQSNKDTFLTYVVGKTFEVEVVAGVAIATVATATTGGLAAPILIGIGGTAFNSMIAKGTEELDKETKALLTKDVNGALSDYLAHGHQPEDLDKMSNEDRFRELRKTSVFKDLNPKVFGTPGEGLNFQITNSVYKLLDAFVQLDTEDKLKIVQQSQLQEKQIAENNKKLEQVFNFTKKQAETFSEILKSQAATQQKIADSTDFATKMAFKNLSWTQKQDALKDNPFLNSLLKPSDVLEIAKKAAIESNIKTGKEYVGYAKDLAVIANVIGVDKNTVSDLNKIARYGEAALSAYINFQAGNPLGAAASIAGLFANDGGNDNFEAIFQGLAEIKKMLVTVMSNQQKIMEALVQMDKKVELLGLKLDDIKNEVLVNRQMIYEFSQTGLNTCVSMIEEVKQSGVTNDLIEFKEYLRGNTHLVDNCLNWFVETASDLDNAFKGKTQPPSLFLSTSAKGATSSQANSTQLNNRFEAEQNVFDATHLMISSVPQGPASEGQETTESYIYRQVMQSGPNSYEQVDPHYRVKLKTSDLELATDSYASLNQAFLNSQLFVPAIYRYAHILLELQPLRQVQSIAANQSRKTARTTLMHGKKDLDNLLQLIDYGIVQERLVSGIGWMKWFEQTLLKNQIYNYVSTVQSTGNPPVEDLYSSSDASIPHSRHDGVLVPKLNADALFLLRNKPEIAQNFVRYLIMVGRFYAGEAGFQNLSSPSIFNDEGTGTRLMTILNPESESALNSPYTIAFNRLQTRSGSRETHLSWNLLLGGERSLTGKALPIFRIPVLWSPIFDTRKLVDVGYAKSNSLEVLEELRVAVVNALAEYAIAADQRLSAMINKGFQNEK